MSLNLTIPGVIGLNVLSNQFLFIWSIIVTQSKE